jgi:hypothetical protein
LLTAHCPSDINKNQSKALRNTRHAAQMDTYDPPPVYSTPPAKTAQGKTVYSMIASIL